MLNRREARPGRQIVLESFDAFGRTFRERLNPSVVEVLDIANDLMTGGGALRKKPKAYALHIAADKKLACYPRHLDMNLI